MISLVFALLLQVQAPQGVLYFWDDHCVFACYKGADGRLVMPCHAAPFPRWLGGPELCQAPQLPDGKLRVRGPGLHP